MTSVGRGRGWGSKQDKGLPLRRPGETTADMEVDTLIAAVQGINLQGANESVATLKGVEDLLKKQCQTEEDLRLVVQCLHDRSLEDRQFGMKAAVAYGSVASLEVAGVRLRNILLLAVQKDFEDRTHLQTACTVKFLNAIALLGEIFHQVRLPTGSPINILASAVLQYQDMLLGGEEHELELFTTQLAVNGRKLYDCKHAELEELMLRVRTTLMSRNLSGQCRCWLLLALDLAANRYAPLSGQLQGFYQVHLGANAIMQLQRFQVGLKIDTDSGRTEVNRVSTSEISESVKRDLYGEDVNGILAKCRSAGETDGENCASRSRETARRTVQLDAKPSFGGGRKPEEELSQAGVDGVKWSISIGGDGGSGGGRKFNGGFRKKDLGYGRQDRDPNEDIWGTARGQKGHAWCHDDRFEKDDDFYGKQAQRGEGAVRPKSRSASSGNWRDRRGSEGRDEKTTHRSETNEIKPQHTLVAPPSLPEEENWDS